MQRGLTWIAGLAAGLMLCPRVEAVSPETLDPFREIVQRNVFGLRPPPPPHAARPPALPLPQIKLVGIAELFGVKKAVLKVTERRSPAGSASDPSLVLEEGQREKDVEVLQIDAVKDTVKVNNHGTVMVLKLETATPKAAAGPPLPIPWRGFRR